MAQIKMKYGIDLGTTNSALCKMENGDPTIKKTDTLKDTLPSCVSFTRKKIVKVGDSAYNDLRQDKARATKRWTKGDENVFIEFKREMGLDTPHESRNMERSYSAEELSAEVLKSLKSLLTDDSMNACVITVPAKFKTDQIAATKRAATLAGIAHCELLQEPIAASMAYGLSDEKKDGIWLVFDFGGGTFDAALVKVEDGIMQVKDTEGDNYLGGKNLDYAIVDDIIIPYLQQNYVIGSILNNDAKRQILREAMKFYAEQAKIQLTFRERCDITSQLDEFGEDDAGTEIELDMVITQAELSMVVSPIYQRAIDICKQLLSRNHISGDDLDSLILVGGPTLSPILREQLKLQITERVDTRVDPMTVVARGAALYASTIDYEATEEMESGTIALDLSYESNSVETTELVTAKLLLEECTGRVPLKVFVELTRADRGWSSGKVEIDEVGDIIECQLLTGKANVFTVTAYDETGAAVPCFPREVNIMQGIVVGSAVLPYNIGFEAHDINRNKDVFVPLKGLEKNQPIPAVGVKNGLKIPAMLRPGMSTDRLVIPIYLGEHNSEGTNAIYNDHVTDIIITGDDVPVQIAANSDIDITVKVDRSQMMTVEVTFLVIGETIDKDIDVRQRPGVSEEELTARLEEARKKLTDTLYMPGVEEGEVHDAQQLLSDIQKRFSGEKNTEDGKMHLLADLRRVFQRLEVVEKAHEWDSLETELTGWMESLEEANATHGSKYSVHVADLRRRTDLVVRRKDTATGRQLLNDIKSAYFEVTRLWQLTRIIIKYHDNFNDYKWTDATRARGLLSRGMSIINSNPNVAELDPLTASVQGLLNAADSEKPII